jgi:hypothetical protein
VIEIVNKGLNLLNGVYGGVTRHNIKSRGLIMSIFVLRMLRRYDSGYICPIHRFMSYLYWSFVLWATVYYFTVYYTTIYRPVSACVSWHVGLWIFITFSVVSTRRFSKSKTPLYSFNNSDSKEKKDLRTTFGRIMPDGEVYKSLLWTWMNLSMHF